MARLLDFIIGFLIVCAFILFYVLVSNETSPPVIATQDKLFNQSESRTEQPFPLLSGFNFTFKSVKEVWLDLYDALPNFPTYYVDETKFAVTACSHVPHLWEIDFNNMLWQRYKTSNGTFYLFGAYLDIRKANKHGPAIRVIGMLDRLDPSMQTFCHIWINESKPAIITPIKEYTFLWRPEWTFRNPKIFQPYMITCVLPDEINGTVPLSVSLVENKCDVPSNNLRVVLNILEPGQKKAPFAVCVKGLKFPTSDASIRILEWLEMLSILGASKVFIYNMGVHPNLQKVLDYYIKKGFLKLSDFTLPAFLPIEPLMQLIYLKQVNLMQMLSEIIQYHDCIYRNMYLYEYVALIDVDELLIPRTVDNWHQLVEQIQLETNRTWTTLAFDNIYFMNEMFEYHAVNNPDEVQKLIWDIPTYMHILTRIFRHVNMTQSGHAIKSLHKVEDVLIIHNHYPIQCLGSKGCEQFYVNETFGRSHHYRSDCKEVFGSECEIALNTSILDTSIWKYRERITNRSLHVMKELGFY